MADPCCRRSYHLSCLEVCTLWRVCQRRDMLNHVDLDTSLALLSGVRLRDPSGFRAEEPLQCLGQQLFHAFSMLPGATVGWQCTITFCYYWTGSDCGKLWTKSHLQQRASGLPSFAMHKLVTMLLSRSLLPLCHHGTMIPNQSQIPWKFFHNETT